MEAEPPDLRYQDLPGNAYPEALPPFWEVFCRVRRCQNFALSLGILDGDAPDYCVVRSCEIVALSL